MNKIIDSHLSRPAYVYIRQSTTDQVHLHPESRRRQYQLKDRARELGWSEVVVIDDDLGRSGAGIARPGFDRLIAAVCKGEVGAVISSEASRLSRNGRDWHTLLEFCGLVDTLLIDEDGIYDPRQPNDRLLLGMKGTMSEMELSTFHQRSQHALAQKAKRGELFTSVAIGYVRVGNNRIEKDPNRRIQKALALVYEKFREFGSVRQVLLWLRQEKVDLPAIVYGADGRRVVWKQPVYNTVHRLLTNPLYAGVYAYGRTASRVTIVDGHKQIARGLRRDRAQWDVLIVDHHDSYISWDEYQANQAVITNNATGMGEFVRGAVRRGEAILPGLLRCGHCGRKLSVQYTGKNGSVIRYVCRGMMINHGSKNSCIAFGAIRVERIVAERVLALITPLGIDAAFEAQSMRRNQIDQAHEQRRLALEQACYERDLARKQYDAVDPANRLVAHELERRWNDALRHVQRCEQGVSTLEATTLHALTEEQRQRLLMLADDLPSVWHHPAASPQIKQRIVRLLIKEIVAFVQDERIRLVIHWQGGDHSELEVRKNRTGHHRWKTDTDIVRIIRTLARLMPDSRIAGLLNRLGTCTTHGHPWTRNRVCGIRNDRGIAVYEEGERQARGELTLKEAAERLGVSTTTIRRLIKRELLSAEQACSGAPIVIREVDLLAPAVRRALRNPSDTANRRQQSLNLQ